MDLCLATKVVATKLTMYCAGAKMLIVVAVEVVVQCLLLKLVDCLRMSQLAHCASVAIDLAGSLQALDSYFDVVVVDFVDDDDELFDDGIEFEAKRQRKAVCFGLLMKIVFDYLIVNVVLVFVVVLFDY